MSLNPDTSDGTEAGFPKRLACQSLSFALRGGAASEVAGKHDSVPYELRAKASRQHMWFQPLLLKLQTQGENGKWPGSR